MMLGASVRPSVRSDLTNVVLAPTVVHDILVHAAPQKQAESPSNLGFGYIYYALGRVLRPHHVLVIGSGNGFSVVTSALALLHNGSGHLTFVDPSEPGSLAWGRAASNWSNQNSVRSRFERFGVADVVTHYGEYDTDFFARYDERRLPQIDLALIDGNHKYEFVRFDFRSVLRHMSNGYILLHDVSAPWYTRWGVSRYLHELRQSGWSVVTLVGGFGLALVQVSPMGRPRIP